MKIEITKKQSVEAFNNGWFLEAKNEEILAAWIYTFRVVCPLDKFDDAYHAVMGKGYWNTDRLSDAFCERVLRVIGTDVIKSKDDLARILKVKL